MKRIFQEPTPDSSRSLVPVDPSAYIRILQKTRIQIEVKNFIKYPSQSSKYKISIFNRLPSKCFWNKGVEDLSWDISGGSIKPDNENSNYVLNKTSSSLQCDPLPSEVLVWEGDSEKLRASSREDVICKYNYVTSRRRFKYESYMNAEIKNLSYLPDTLRTQAEKLRSSIDPKIAEMALGQISGDRRIVYFIQAASDFCRSEIKRGVIDAKGNWIFRYDYKTVFNERLGWCGPISSLFRAFCLAAGIPCREVSGYSLRKLNMVDGEINMDDRRGLPDPNKDGNAHIWAEIYFPKAGWIEVDVGSPQCFEIPETFIRVSGIEGPCIVYRDQNGRQSSDSFGAHITVKSRG